MGFSQGCAMTLMAGLRHGERLAGLVGLSGYLPLAAHRGRAARGQSRRADLPRARHAPTRSSRSHAARVARRADGARLPGRVARVPDAALGLRRRDRRPESLAAARAAAASGSARPAAPGAARPRSTAPPSTDEARRGGSSRARRGRPRPPSARSRSSAASPQASAAGLQHCRSHRRGHDQHDEQDVVEERTVPAHDVSPVAVDGARAADPRSL